MHTLADLTRALNRSTVYLSGLQSRFELPTFDGAGYSEAYLAFLQTVVHLRTLSITEETLRDLWHIEKKLLALLHADSTGSPTWFLDSCVATTSPKRRLLLTNYELGAEVHGKGVQLGLNFADTAPELFAGQEMGEDAHCRRKGRATADTCGGGMVEAVVKGKVCSTLTFLIKRLKYRAHGRDHHCCLPLCLVTQIN